MNPRELILLSPYRVPAKDSLMLGDEDVACFLNAYTALWHPAALYGSAEPPRVASPYDYDNPVAGHVYAIPESPPVFLPDDWDQRVRDVGAVAFRAGANREATLENMKEAFRASDNRAAGAEQSEAPDVTPTGASQSLSPGHSDAKVLLDLDPAEVAPFFGIGFGHMHLVALFEAMDHDNLLSGTEFWQDVQDAAAALLRSDAEACRAHLQSAADRLLAGREALYPTGIHVVDVCLLDEQPRDRPLPAAADHGAALNVVTSGSFLESFAADQPEAMNGLRERVRSEHVEVCAGAYVERADALLPLESQLWNLLKGLNVCRDLLGSDVRVYARKRAGASAQLPLLLASAGLQRALVLSFDHSSRAPAYGSPSVGFDRPVEVFARTPYRADSAQTYFHVAHYLHQTIAHDFVGSLSLLHRDKPASPWYQDWLELSKLAPVLGKWTTLSGYFTEVVSGEQASASADDFQDDYLTERTERHDEQPVSAFAYHARRRRRIDMVYTLAALYRGMAGKNDHLQLAAQLADLEDRLEQVEGREVARDVELAEAQKAVGEHLAERLLSRAKDGNPGFLILNPCSFTRRVALELEGITGELPVEGPLKACQVDADKARLVVEVPALGFAWIPRTPAPGPRTPVRGMRLADERHVRNEFFEASIDPVSGGLRGLWDHRTPVSRVGQQLVYNPGSVMRASAIKVTSAGPALGEVVSEGAIFDEHDAVLAKFRQRFRAWLGRPVLELRIEIYPEHPPAGYPWHAYYGARFAWRDERALLLRGVNGTSTITSHTRPDSPDFLEWRLGKQRTTLFPGGLPFHQRHGSRMLDVILVPEGETGQVFDLALGLDREQPMLTALGMVTPVAVVPVAKGPPHVGASGWLFHLDAPNLLLTGMRPAPAGEDALTARVLECSAYSTHAELRCIRNPQRAVLLNARGEYQSEASVQDDAAMFDVNAGDFAQLRVEFT